MWVWMRFEADKLREVRPDASIDENGWWVVDEKINIVVILLTDMKWRQITVVGMGSDFRSHYFMA